MRFRPKNPHTSAGRRQRAREEAVPAEPHPPVVSRSDDEALKVEAERQPRPDLTELRRAAGSTLHDFELGGGFDWPEPDLRTADQRLTDDIYEYLFVASFDTSDVEVTSSQGLITLTGSIDRPKRLEQLVLGVPGVVAVDCQVRAKSRRPLRPLEGEPHPAPPSWPGPVVALSPPTRRSRRGAEPCS